MNTKMIRTVDLGIGGKSHPKSAMIRSFFTIALPIALIVLPQQMSLAQDSSKEYQIKMAFIVNIVKFVEWPDNSIKKGQPFVIGVIGKVPLNEGERTIPDIKVNKRNVVMQVHHKWDPNSTSQMNLINNCQALFVSKSEQSHASELIQMVRRREVMTVGEFDDFLESGGIFNFELEKNKVRFSVNMKHANEAKLSIRSKLLRLAKHVYQ